MKVYIIGIGSTALGRAPDKSVKDLTREAVQLALTDAGASMKDIDAAWFSNTRQGIMENQNTIRGQCSLRAMGFESIPIINVENACCSSSTGLNQAFAQIKAGLSEIALVVGAEKMFYPEHKDLMFKAFLGGWDVHDVERSKARLLGLGEGLDLPKEAHADTGQHSVFMDIYASLARQHMRLHGTTMRQIAAAAAKSHYHATMNPLAQYRVDMSVDEVLSDKLIAWPLTRAMCAPISDGAAALVVCSEETLARFDGRRAVEVLASALVSGSDRPPDDLAHHIGRIAANRAYNQAGIGPDDLDVVEVHDASAYAEILQTENLGLCAPGEGGVIAERGETRLGGRIPVNTSGGLVSKGHPIGATGAIQLHELVVQLRGEAGPRQVDGARFGAAENGGGFFGLEEAATVVTILGNGLMQPIEFFFRAARYTPDVVAVIAPQRCMTFRELAAEVQRLAAFLNARDPTPQTRVCVGCSNSVEHLIAILAVLAAGKIWVALNPRNGDPELQRCVEFTEPCALLLDEGMAGRIAPGSVPVFLLDGPKAGTVFHRAHNQDSQFAATHLPLDAIQAIKFTGGTSGTPKGVMQPYRAWNTNIVTQRAAYGFTARDRYLVAAPLTHGASTYILPILGAGGAFVFPEESNPKAYLHAIAEHEATTLFAPPTLVTMLVEAARNGGPATPSLRNLIYGGAAMRPSRIVDAQNAFGPVIAATYGQTEASQVISIVSAAELMSPENHAAAGRPSLFTEVGIMSPDGALLPMGVQGEVVVRGDLIMGGYWRMPEQTAATIVDGWLHTGDVGLFDERGYLFLRDRLRDVIITGGFNVYPSDVETVLSAYPGVAECAVFGVPDERWGEAVHAAVEPRPGVAIDQDDLLAYLKREIGSVKTPKALHVLASLPKSAVGKVLKSAVRAQVAARKP